MSYLKIALAGLGLLFATFIALALRDRSVLRTAAAELKEARLEHQRAKQWSSELKVQETGSVAKAAKHRHLAQKAEERANQLKKEIANEIDIIPDSVRVRQLRARLSPLRERGGSGRGEASEDR